MKYAYVSAVLHSSDDTDIKSIIKLDENLSATCQLHEIIIITKSDSFSRELQLLSFDGPVTILTNTEVRESDALKIEALTRSVGDFIIEWNGNIEDISLQLIEDILNNTDQGIELTEIEGKVRFTERLFLKLLNKLRKPQMPILSNVGIAFSRYALNQLISKSHYESKFQILVANLTLTRRTHMNHNSRTIFHYPVGHKVDLLTRGTSIGSTIPFILATISALIGAGSAIYATSLYVFIGTLPQGWTTLMIAIGLGNASILTLLGFIWSKLSVIQFGIGSHRNPNSECHVISPNLER